MIIHNYYETPNGEMHDPHYGMFSYAGDAEVHAMILDFGNSPGGYVDGDLLDARMRDITRKYPEIQDTVVREKIHMTLEEMGL